MAYFKDNAFKPDPWHLAGEAEPIQSHAILPLKTWRANPNPAANLELGLWLEPGTEIGEIAQDLQRFSLIVINFPKFTDGRGYSMAKQIRDSYGFHGELRAAGDILFDQLQLLARCGFDAFEIKNAATIKLLEHGRRPALAAFYQPGLLPETPAGSRPWTRKAAP